MNEIQARIAYCTQRLNAARQLGDIEEMQKWFDRQSAAYDDQRKAEERKKARVAIMRQLRYDRMQHPPIPFEGVE